MDETVKSIILTVDGERYELDFDRDSARFTEEHNVTLGRLTAGVPTAELVKDLFWCSFRKNHKRLTKMQTDVILEKMGGMSMKMFTRLTDLFTQAAYTGVILNDDEDDKLKNPAVTVEM